MTLRLKKRGEKALEHALRSDAAAAAAAAAQGSSKAKNVGRSNPKINSKREDPSPVTVRSPLALSVHHRRELAQADADEAKDT
jgi:hypothetical protein